MSVADKIIGAVQNKDLRHFFLVAGCDGAKPGRNYYTEFVEKAPKDSVILTLACGKFRFFDMELGDIGGIPRLLDVGQCNDAYSAVKIAVALADQPQDPELLGGQACVRRLFRGPETVDAELVQTILDSYRSAKPSEDGLIHTEEDLQARYAEHGEIVGLLTQIVHANEDLQGRLDQAEEALQGQAQELELVGVRGFEPPTPSSRTKCATRLRYCPFNNCDLQKIPRGHRGPPCCPNPAVEPGPQWPDRLAAARPAQCTGWPRSIQ